MQILSKINFKKEVSSSLLASKLRDTDENFDSETLSIPSINTTFEKNDKK